MIALHWAFTISRPCANCFICWTYFIPQQLSVIYYFLCKSFNIRKLTPLAFQGWHMPKVAHFIINFISFIYLCFSVMISNKILAMTQVSGRTGEKIKVWKLFCKRILCLEIKLVGQVAIHFNMMKRRNI